MKFRLSYLFFALAIFLVTGSHAISVMAAEKIVGNSGVDFLRDKIIISVVSGVDLVPFQSYKASTSINPSIDRIIASENIINIEPFYPHPIKHKAIRDIVSRMFILTLGERGDVSSAVASLRETKIIETADPYYIYHLDYIPNDPLISSWYQLSRIDAYGAWDFIRGDSTNRPILGIVDSGVYYDHPELEPNMWINTLEDIDGDGRFTSADINGIDEDGNGFVDDVVGYDVAMDDPDPQEPTPTHGTHVAGCASMASDNNYGGASVGWAARIMAVKCAFDSQPDNIPYGFQGIVYATDNGCDVINLSWGRAGGPSGGEQNVITAAYNAGVVVVAAAGNDHSSGQFFPAQYNHVVAVAATDENDHLADFSNYGTWIDICAPGVSVPSTWSHNMFAALSGTSMASPVTAGTVCLIKAADTSQTVDQIVQRLEDNADTIDALNPGYEGLLGAGRVNAAAAIGRGRLPRLFLDHTTLRLTVDDGDSLLNPGERFNLVATLLNRWNAASNVNATIRSDSQFVVVDSTASFGDIPGNGGTGSNDLSPFDVMVNSDASIGNHQFAIHITTGEGPQFEYTFNINVTLEQRGFPGNIPGNIESSPLVVDVNGDNHKKILVSASNGNYYSFESDGSMTPGWPQPISGESPGGAAVGDIDGDHINDIVGMSRDGNIYAWHSDGTLLPGFPHNCGSLMFGTPVLADIDGDSRLEIMIGGFISHQFYVIKYDGTNFPGWPFQGPSNFYGSAAVADIDNDSLPEIICGDFDSTLYAWSSDQSNVPGFPVRVSGQIKGSPSVADIDGDGNLNIVVGTTAGNLYAFDNDGSIMPGWPVRLGTSTFSTPSLADIDLDGHLEILIGCNDSRLYVFNSDGQPKPGFPVSVSGTITASPVVGDIDGDGYPDIAFGTSDGIIYAFDHLGLPLRNFPISSIAQGQITGSSALADLDGDGDCEIVTGVKTAGNNLEVIDYKAHLSAELFPWPFFGKDIRRTGYYGTFITGIEGGIDMPVNYSLDQNYPNPFNATTLIRFAIPREGHVDLAIYDLLGRHINSLNSGNLQAGYHEIVWNGTDESGMPAASGIYFYKLNAANMTLTKKMILIK
jgi:serine protease